MLTPAANGARAEISSTLGKFTKTEISDLAAYARNKPPID